MLGIIKGKAMKRFDLISTFAFAVRTGIDGKPTSLQTNKSNSPKVLYADRRGYGKIALIQMR